MTNFSYTDTEPAPNSTPSFSQPLMLVNCQSIEGLIAVDHVGFNSNNGGQHKAIEFNQDTSYVPIPPVSPPQLFTNTVSGLPQLFYYSGDAAHSANQYVANANGSTFLLGGMIMKWGVIGPVGAGGTTITFPVAFPNACYVVTATALSASTPSVSVSSIGTTSFVAKASSSTNACYIAIGN